jgi:hypothetical protein
MESITLSLALGAAAMVGQEVINISVQEAYTGLKNLIRGRYPQVSIDPIEQAPASKARRAVVEEDLTSAGATQDAELAAAALALIDLIQKHEPATAQAIGVDLKEVSAANLRLADISARSTGVKVEKGTFSGDIDIRGVRAGVSPIDRKDD